MPNISKKEDTKALVTKYIMEGINKVLTKKATVPNLLALKGISDVFIKHAKDIDSALLGKIKSGDKVDGYVLGHTTPSRGLTKFDMQLFATAKKLGYKGSDLFETKLKKVSELDLILKEQDKPHFITKAKKGTEKLKKGE